MRKLAHVAIAVHDLDESLHWYRDALGLECEGSEEVPEQKVRTAFLCAGGTTLELLAPTSPDSPVAKFLKSRGAGLHHLAFEVADLDAEMKRLQAAGAAFTSDRPRPGAHGSRVAFLHPKASGGTLIELCEPAEPALSGA